MQQDSIAASNLLALKNKEYEINFDLKDSSYEAVETIGTGAYGVVCSAVHRRTKAPVAIKKIPDIFAQDVIAKRTFREIKILKHFKHDNIINIREILKPTDPIASFKDVYIVLDLMESDMHRVIHSKQDLTDEHVFYFLYQILRGLKYIHSANIIHRDLKPSNLLVNANCDLKIGDFGMARALSANPEDHNHLLTQYVATRWYRAPEIMLAPVAYSSAVDTWSVGCILAEMLGRRQLFPGKDYVHQLKLIFGIMGTPTEEYLQMIPNGNIKNFVRNLGSKKPENLRRLYPKAPGVALDMLARLLDLHPNRRIAISDSLRHPCLKEYHDPEEEPVCLKKLSFEFEKLDLPSNVLKDKIIAEIMDYHKPKPKLNFTFRPVPKSELQKTPSPRIRKEGKGDDPLASLTKAEPKQTINTKQLTEPDIEMLSAKLSAATVKEGSDNQKLEKVGDLAVKKGEQVVGEISTEAKPINAKEALKNALLNARMAKMRGERPPRPVTAVQRQREREEKRKQKLQKAKEKKKKKQKQSESPLKLTDADRSLLERWKNMQKPNDPIQAPTTTSLQQMCASQHLPSTSAHQSVAPNALPVVTTAVERKDSLSTLPVVAPTESVVASKDTAVGLFDQMTFIANPLLPSNTPALPVGQTIPAGNMRNPLLLQNQQPTTTANNETSPGLESLLAELETRPQPPQTQTAAAASHAANQREPPSYTEAVQTDSLPFIHIDSRVELPFNTFNTDKPQERVVPNVHVGPGAQPGASLEPMWGSQGPLRSREELTPLAHTPKGTGAGYGVGLDLDAILAETRSEQKSSEARQDSAPLSATLIRDWLDMTGNFNLENALQMDMGSPGLFSDSQPTLDF